ncbi:hypothetical protein [Longibacter salinarum]|nr:hypothetical protein [Longibacter salinarum]
MQMILAQHDMSFGVVLTLVLLLSGCIWRLGVNGKHYTHQSQPGVIDTSVLRLDGYYTHLDTTWSERLAQPLILWKDGTAAHSGISGERRVVYGSPHATPFESPSEVHKIDHFEHSLLDKTGERDSPINLLWGGFRVFDDSISIQTMRLYAGANIVFQKFMNDPWTYVGHIPNDTTIVITELIRPNYFAGRSREPIDPPRVFRFQPLPPGVKPSSDNWTQFHENLQ